MTLITPKIVGENLEITADGKKVTVPLTPE